MKIIKSYDLVNDPADPLWVRVVDGDGAAHQPVQFQGLLEIHTGTLANGVTEFYNVPAGKRLVIEHISARCNGLAGNDTLDLEVYTTLNGVMVQHSLGLVGPPGRQKQDPNAQASQVLCQPVRLYADPATHVSVMGNRVTRINNAQIMLALSGYLVDVP